eukprot:2055527-Prymnesium_polylepis.1
MASPLCGATRRCATTIAWTRATVRGARSRSFGRQRAAERGCVDRCFSTGCVQRHSNVAPDVVQP